LDPSFHLNQKPQKPVKITEDNWLDYVEEANSKKESGGSEKDGAILYWSYLEFFDKEIRDHGIGKTLEKFVFSEEGVEKGLMLSRVMGGALHPLIHIGYGAEFEIGGIVAEGEFDESGREVSHLTGLSSSSFLALSTLNP